MNIHANPMATLPSAIALRVGAILTRAVPLISLALGPVLTSALLSALAIATAATSAFAATGRISLGDDGREANASSTVSSISADGRRVAFASLANNLVDGDTNGASDVFVRDRDTGTLLRVSVASDGTQAAGSSVAPSISADGRWVAFASSAANLAPGDGNGAFDVFVHDLLTGVTERVSIAGDGSEGDGDSFQPAISGDGRTVVFASLAGNLVGNDGNGNFDVFARFRDSGTTARLSESASGGDPNGASLSPRISFDGSVVVFQSGAGNLVPGDTNGRNDVFAVDLAAGTLTRVSVATDGAQGNQQSVGANVSGDGRWVGFDSDANNLVDGDGNGRTDVFVHDRLTGTTERVSLASDGTEGSGQSGFFDAPALSADGRFVAFTSAAPNLVPDDTNAVVDAFVRDRATGEVRRASVSSSGEQGDGPVSLWAGLTANGDTVVFASSAGNLVADDDNGVQDVFVVTVDCGNGVLDAGESCDDGNRLDGDCCSATCAAEAAGSACDDGDLCTLADACDGAGACRGGDPVICPAADDSCHAAGACDPDTGACPVAPLPDGAPCDDGDACTAGDACVAGACTPGEPDPAACVEPLRCRDATLSLFDLFREDIPRVHLADTFGARSAWVLWPARLCATAVLAPSGEPPVGEASGALLECRGLAPTSLRPAFEKRRVEVSNDLGAQSLVVQAPREVCLSSHARGESGERVLDDFQCYRVAPSEGSAAGRRFEVGDRFGSARVAVGRAEAFCSPVSWNGRAVERPDSHLVCYATRDEDRSTRLPGSGRPPSFSVENDLGRDDLYLSSPGRLCLPTALVDVRIEPETRR